MASMISLETREEEEARREGGRELKLGEFAANLPTEQIARIIIRLPAAINRAPLELKP